MWAGAMFEPGPGAGAEPTLLLRAGYERGHWGGKGRGLTGEHGGSGAAAQIGRQGRHRGACGERGRGAQ